MKRPKLLYVIGVSPTKIGGIEIFAREFAVQLDRRKWDVVLCFEAFPPELVSAFLSLPNVSIEVLPDQGTSSISQLIQLVTMILKHRPAIFIYAFNGVLRAYPWLAKAVFVKKVFYNDHSSRPIGFVSRRASLAKRAIARLITWPVSGSICVSGFVKRCADNDGFLPADRISIVYNGVDLARTSNMLQKRDRFRRRCEIASDEKVVVQVSWLVPQKGVDVLLRAARRVLEQLPKVKFVLVGGGAQRSIYEGLARQLGIAEKVHWTGPIENPTEEGAFAGADVYCQSSQWEEACPLSILEAMSFSVPVVATLVGGIPELVSNDESGFLVPRDDEAALADRILRLLTDEGLRQEMGRAGRRRVEAMFDVRNTASQYLSSCGIT